MVLGYPGGQGELTRVLRGSQEVNEEWTCHVAGPEGEGRGCEQRWLQKLKKARRGILPWRLFADGWPPEEDNKYVLF